MFAKNKIFSFPNMLLFILSGINIFLLTLPLTNVLHYEFSAVNGILQSFCGGLLGIYFINKNSIKKELQFNVFKTNYKFLLILTFSQFLLGFISNLIFQICPFSDGALFYFVITIPSFYIGIIVGIFSLSISQKFSYLVFVVIWLLILTAPVSELFANPQIYFYNPIIGFFPGTIYDEDISVTFSLVFYRLLNLAFFSLLFISIINKKTYRINVPRSLRLLFVIITVVSFSLLKPLFGFSTDIERIETSLKGKIETEHFIIFYPEVITQIQIDNLVLNHEYAFSELSKELNDKPKDKIISFVFKDGAQKGELFGANNADVAKPWLYQIYVNYANFRATLQHELAHVFSANYGNTIFKIADNFNPVLIEGFATSLANNYDDNDIHYMAKLADQAGYKISLKSFFTGFNFFGQTSSIAYIYAGSFMKYLSEKYGIEKLKELYGNLDFEEIYSKSIDELEKEYFLFLDAKNYNVKKSTAELYYGRKPIFKKFCARYVANQTRKGFEFYQKNNYSKAEQVFSEIYRVSDSYQALVGKANSLVKLDHQKESLSFVKEEIKKFDETSYFFNLEIVLGSLFIHNKENNQADSVYTKLSEQDPSENYKNAAFFRKLLLQESDTSAIKYLKAEPAEKLEIVKKMLYKYKSPELVPIYLDLSKEENYNEKKEFLDSLGEQIFSANSLFEISQLASENNDFELAVEYIAKAIPIELSSNKRIIYKDYLKKYNWCKNYGTDVLSGLY